MSDLEMPISKGNIVKRLAELSDRYQHPAPRLVAQNILHGTMSVKDDLLQLAEVLLKENAKLKSIALKAINNSALPPIVVQSDEPIYGPSQLSGGVLSEQDAINQLRKHLP